MLDLDNDEIFEAALLGSLGLTAYPTPAQQPAGELRDHLAGLLNSEVIGAELLDAAVSQCAVDALIPAQRSDAQVLTS